MPCGPCPGRFPFCCRNPCPDAGGPRLSHTGTYTHIRAYTHVCYRMSHPPPAAVDTDEQQQPQCRICLDGPDPDLGRLIRPCLCSGTVSVRQTFPCPSCTIALTELSSHRSLNVFRCCSMYTSHVSSVGGTRPPMPLPSLFVHNATIVTALLAPRLLASRPTQVRPLSSNFYSKSAFSHHS